jgi:hypothetical protein
MHTSIETLTQAQAAAFETWVDLWVQTSLSTAPADREKFERSVRDCYRFAGIPFPEVIVWAPSPLALARAAPTAALTIELTELFEAGGGDQLEAIIDVRRRDPRDGEYGFPLYDSLKLNGALSGRWSFFPAHVSNSLGPAVLEILERYRGARNEDSSVAAAVRDALNTGFDTDRYFYPTRLAPAINGLVDQAVQGAVGGAPSTVVNEVLNFGRAEVIRDHWTWGVPTADAWWGATVTSFIRSVLGVELPGDVLGQARALEGTLESAGWWWPHRRFVMVCEHPLAFHCELVDATQPRGQDAYRLHSHDGPAVVWPDGWGIWMSHGVQVPRQVVEAPETLTVAQIQSEWNVELRRVMLERFGTERYLRESWSRFRGKDEYGTLWESPVPHDEPLVMVEVGNATPEPDGTFKTYFLRVPPSMRTPREAIAWTFGMAEGEYAPDVQS